MSKAPVGFRKASLPERVPGVLEPTSSELRISEYDSAPSSRDSLSERFHLPGICLIQGRPDGMITLLETKAAKPSPTPDPWEKVVVKVGLATIHNVHSRPARGASYISGALSSRFQVDHLGAGTVRSARGGGTHRFLNRHFSPTPRHASLERAYASVVSQQLEAAPVDLLVGLFASNIIPQIDLPEGLPVVHISDTTCFRLREQPGAYPSSNVLQRRRRIAFERQALEQSDLCVFPSAWAARSAVDDFGIDPSRVHVIEWGGADLQERQPSRCVERFSTDPIELLFIGHSAKRKGLDRVIAATCDLARRGRRVRLTTIGARVPRWLRSGLVRSLGRLDLQDPSGRATYEEAMRSATCLVHPARAECYGHVLVEACERGVPVICTRVGGMPTIIRDRENGLLIDADFETSELVDGILQIADDPVFARRLSTRARLAWEQRLSWRRWADRFQALVTPLVEATTTQKRTRAPMSEPVLQRS